MDIHEYQAKEILAKFGVPIPKGALAYSPEQAAYRAREIGGKLWVVKAQVHTGGRGKAGGVKLCRNEDEVTDAADELLVALAKALSLAVIAFGLIASAVCGLLGPIFVPFFVVPKLEWLFWGWLKSFIQYSFIPVVAIAFLMIFEQFVFRYVTTLPPTITSAEYGVYALQAVAVIATFCVGMVMVPSLTNSIFSGHGGQTMISSVPRILRLR